MSFSDAATPKQAGQIKGFLSLLENDYGGLENITLARVRTCGDSYRGAPCLGDPQCGYLLVKAWLKLAETKGLTIPKLWYDVVEQPNGYLNPFYYLNDDTIAELTSAWDEPMSAPYCYDFDHRGQIFTY